MGIYIKGIPMPTSCESCPCKTADAFGGLGCQATGYIPLRKANQDRPDNCPLIPVPDHGDLIDADAMKKSVKQQTDFLRLFGGELEEIADLLGKWVLQEIDNAPTIIPADVTDIDVGNITAGGASPSPTKTGTEEKTR